MDEPFLVLVGDGHELVVVVVADEPEDGALDMLGRIGRYFVDAFTYFVHLFIDEYQPVVVFEDHGVALDFVLPFLDLERLIVVEALVLAAPGVVIDIAGSGWHTYGTLGLAGVPGFPIHLHSNNSP